MQNIKKNTYLPRRRDARLGGAGASRLIVAEPKIFFKFIKTKKIFFDYL